jgi:hypothetical protein
MLFLPEGQTGEAWELPKNSSFGNRGELDSHVLVLTETKRRNWDIFIAIFDFDG